MPIHLRASPGDYAEACLLPGDPLRAKYIAETFLRTSRRSTPSAACSGSRALGGQARLRPGNRDGLPERDHRLRGADPARREAAPPRRDLRRAPAGPRARRSHRRDLGRTGRLDRHASRRRRAALPDRELGARPRGRARRQALGRSRSASARSSRATSSTTPTRASTSAGRSAASSRSRWKRRRCSRSAALRGVHGGCLLTVSDIVVEGEFVRISDDELRAAVDRMTRIALDTATAGQNGH